jgi:hypothetical protein
MQSLSRWKGLLDASIFLNPRILILKFPLFSDQFYNALFIDSILIFFRFLYPEVLQVVPQSALNLLTNPRPQSVLNLLTNLQLLLKEVTLSLRMGLFILRWRMYQSHRILTAVRTIG